MEDHNGTMVLDNCPAHLHVELENVKFAFLPPNITSKKQPMDASVICNFKLHYRCMLANRRQQAAEIDKDFKWSLLDCFFAVKSEWSLVNPTTIANCHLKAGFIISYAEQLPRAESSSPQVTSIKMTGTK